MLLTIKFGGTSVENAERIRGVAGLVKRLLDQGHRVVVVTSAMSGVTNQLIALTGQPAPQTAASENQVAQCLEATRRLQQRHLEAARAAISRRDLVEEVDRILYTEMHSLNRVLLGSHLLGEMTPIGYDFVVSAGERFCVPVLTHCLRDLGVDAVGLGGDEAGIVTDGNYGNALPDEERTREGVRRAVLPLLEAGKTPVVAGFFGRSPAGRIAILGRGGSDFTATLLGCSLDADEIWMLKHDVDGIKSTDPRLVPVAHTIAELSYQTAAEMALLGAKVLHPKSVQPAARRQIPVRIASSHEPDKPGTRLVPLRCDTPRVRALTLVRRGGLVRAQAVHMGDEGILPSALMEALRRNNLDVLASATGFNGGRVLWLIGNAELDRFVNLLHEHADERVQVEVQRDVAVLGLVGELVGTAPGLLSRLAHCLQQADMQPLVILQGASPDGLVIAVPDQEARLAAVLKLLHSEFGLDHGCGPRSAEGDRS
jgi:aspartate kinase